MSRLIKRQDNIALHSSSYTRTHGTTAKIEYNNIIYLWQIMFQASKYKGRNFLDLSDNEE